VSVEAIRKRVQRGTIESDKGADGRRYVYLTESQDSDRDGGTDALAEELRDRVRFVEGQLEAERQAHAEARRIIGGLVQRIPELEAREPSDSTAQDAPETQQPRPDRGLPPKTKAASRRHQPRARGGVGCSVADRLEAIEVGGVQVEHLSHDGATGN
jgi:hypothetical protein